MPFNLKEKDQRRLDAFLEGVLNAYKNDEVELVTARGAIAHVMIAAAIDNEGEVQSWLYPERIENWKAQANAHRT